MTMTKYHGETHWHDGREDPVEQYDYYLAADVDDRMAELTAQLAVVTQERDALRGELQTVYKIVGGYDKPCDKAVADALATARQAVWKEMRTAISNGKFIPLDTSFNTKEMFEIIHWIEAYIDDQARGASLLHGQARAL